MSVEPAPAEPTADPRPPGSPPEPTRRDGPGLHPGAEPGETTGPRPDSSPDPGAGPSGEAGETVEPALPVFPITAPVAAAPPGRGYRGTIAIVALSLIAVLAGGGLFLSGWTLGHQTALNPGTPADETDLFQPFWDTYSAVTERYAGGEVDRKALVEGAIKGMIGALEDPYSQYLTSEEFRKSLEGLSGQFEGIGATIGTVDRKGASSSCTDLGPDCRMVIVEPLEGAPAEAAGLLAGDVITHIDGDPVAGSKLDEARALVRGPKGTAVVLRIEREGQAPRDVEVIRAIIVTPEVEEDDLAGGRVGYLKLSGFSEHASVQFADAVKADVDAGRTRLILDLRGNPGGFVTAARDITSQFVADGTIFWQEDADGSLIETVAKPGGAATSPDIQVVVLVDGGSASASEIVAGALKDRGRATLVGTRTFGKGTVQQWTQLEGDRGGFRLTIAKWLTPDRTWIHGVGIEPDVVVDEAPAEPGDDPVLDAALEELGAARSGASAMPAAA